jgi:hypothetical protein
LVPEKEHELLLAALPHLPAELRQAGALGLVLSSGAVEAPAYAGQLRQQLVLAGVEVRTGLSADEVNTALNRCRSGVTLTKSEGGVMAVGEYLLAGLPVVTIRGARGGKNLYLNERNAVFCEPTPGSVASGIAVMASAAIERCLVRESMIRHCLPGSYEDLKQIARRYAARLNQPLGDENPSPVDKLMRFTSLEECGFSLVQVREVLPALLDRWGFVSVTPAPPADGRLRLILDQLPLDQRFEPSCALGAVDITLPGFAFFGPRASPCLRILADGDQVAAVGLERLLSCQIRGPGGLLRVVARPAPEPMHTR